MHTNSVNTNPATVNMGDAKSIMAYSHYLVMKAQLAGNLRFDGHKASEEELEIARQCRTLCDRIARRLDVCKESNIPDLLECYDIVYRIGDKRLPDSNFVNRHKRRVLKAWKAGDKSIEESSVFGMIAPEVSYHPERADMEYVRAYISIRDRWIATLLKHDCFPGVTSYENYQRLAFMMRDKLDMELGYDADNAKRRWCEHNRVNDLSSLGSLILRSYRRFISSLSSGIIDFHEKMELDCKIVEELSTRPDLDPYDREAYLIALEFNRQLTETYQ